MVSKPLIIGSFQTTNIPFDKTHSEISVLKEDYLVQKAAMMVKEIYCTTEAQNIIGRGLSGPVTTGVKIYDI